MSTVAAEVAAVEAEAAQAASAAVTAQVAADNAVRDAEALKDQLVRDAAETIRARDEEIARLKEREQCLTNELNQTKTEVEMLGLSVMGLVALSNPPTQETDPSVPLIPPQEPSSVVVVDPLEAKPNDPAPTNPQEPESPPKTESPKKRHKLL
jgi:hypothetical protein